MVSPLRPLAAIAVVALVGCGSKTEAPPPQVTTTADFRPLVFAASASAPTTFRAEGIGHTVTLEGPDDPGRPTAWEGPLGIEDRHCKADVSLITAVSGAANAGYLIAFSYSGSKRFAHFIDVENCQERWPAIEAFSDGISANGDTLTVLPACECSGSAAAPCQCSAGRVFRLHRQNAPAELVMAGQGLTKNVLGVAFEGERKVLRPKTDTARIVEP